MLVILADDLTGTLDSASPFAGRGMHTEVALTADGIAAALAEKPEVVSINLACREVSDVDARRRVRETLLRLPDNARLFLKVDSRLKGHVAAVLSEIPFRLGLAAPAIPAFERVVVGGRVQGFGVETPIDVVDRLGPQVDRCRIPDTVSDDDMDRVLKDAEQNGTDLLIGARGLAEALARSMSGQDTAVRAEVPAGPILFVIGSRDPITITQMDVLRRDCVLDDRPAPNGRLAHQDAGREAITLVQATPSPEPCSSEEVAARLAESVVPRLAAAASTILMSGGATAEAVLGRLGVERFRLMGECLPGLGLAQVGSLCIIAKSGGFGQPETLSDIANTILRKMDGHGAG